MRSTLKKQEAQRCDIYGALFVFIIDEKYT
jgi:hypothetical protein